MKLYLTHYEYTRNGSRHEYGDGEVSIPAAQERALRKAARDYRTSVLGMIGIILAYYFGDGSNHLGCDDCGYWCPGIRNCVVPQPGRQTTIPILDKGMVVVGNPSDEQGE